MKKPSIFEIIEAQKKLNFKLFNTPFDCNLGAIRSNDKDSNAFNDFAFIWTHNHDGELIYEIVPCTVDAGIFYRINPMRRQGTAIIQHNVQHLRAYQLQHPHLNSKHIGHKGQSAFRQINDMSYWRDNGKTEELNFEGPTFIENAQTNGHYMGTAGIQVNKWSAGCWGSIVENMDKLYRIGDLQVKHLRSDIFSFSLIKEDVLLSL